MICQLHAPEIWPLSLSLLLVQFLAFGQPKAYAPSKQSQRNRTDGVRPCQEAPARAYTVLWAGGGVRGGLVHGASDRNGEAPVGQPATSADPPTWPGACIMPSG